VIDIGLKVAPDQDGPAAPPRKNGELAFSEPWEGRLFGMTMALHEAGLLEWEEFRQRLIAAIAAWDREHAGSEREYRYYSCWQNAFERLLAERGLCATAEIEARFDRLADRPRGHDHEGAHPEDERHAG
jgi:nitrile hydratase accessory protein